MHSTALYVKKQNAQQNTARSKNAQHKTRRQTNAQHNNARQNKCTTHHCTPNNAQHKTHAKKMHSITLHAKCTTQRTDQPTTIFIKAPLPPNHSLVLVFCHSPRGYSKFLSLKEKCDLGLADWCKNLPSGYKSDFLSGGGVEWSGVVEWWRHE